MSSLRSVCALGTGAVILSSFVSSSAFGSLTATYLGRGNNENAQLAYNAAQSWDNANAVNFNAAKLAELKWDVGGTTYYTFCVQIYQGLAIGTTYTFDVVSLEDVPNSPPNPGPMGALKAMVMRDAMTRWLGADSRVIGSAGPAGAASAAFNALVWEISHDNFATTDASELVSRMSLSTGAFRANLSAGAASIFNTMVASLGQGGWLTTESEGWRNGSAQDQIRVVPGPAALALAALAGVSARRRRR
jgi:hypothetical protein